MGDVTAESLIVVGPRRRGRPPAEEPKSHLTLWVPTAYQDRLALMALKHDVSISKVVCAILDRELQAARITEQIK